MKIMICPLNGPRNISEFQCHGEVHELPDPERTSDKEWTDRIWLATNAAGIVREWWCHTPSNFWFLAERDTVTDRILATYVVPPDRPHGALP